MASPALLATRTRLAHAFHQSAGGLPQVYWYLWAGTLVSRLGNLAVPFLALYLTRERGLTVAQAGLVFSLHGVGAVVASPLGGTLADRVGRRATLLGALWLGAGAMLLLGLARTPLQVAGATLLLGLLREMFRPALFAAVSDVVPAPDRVRAFGLLFWVVNVGFAIALPLAGLASRWGFFTLFLIDALATFLFGLLVWWKVPETLPARPERTPLRPSSLLPSPEPFRDGVFLAFGLPVFAMALIFFQSITTLSLDLTARGLTPATYGAVLSLNGVLIMLLQPLSGPLAGRLRRATVLAWASVLIGVGFGLHALPGVGLAVMAVAVWTVGEVAQAAVAPAVVADLSPPELRGSYQGAYHMLWGLASALAPALGGLVLGRWGSEALWGMCLLLGLLSAAWHLAIAGARRERLEALRVGRPDVSVGAE